MSLPLQCALHYRNAWECLVHLAASGNGFSAIWQIAEEGQVSENSVRNKMNVAAFHLRNKPIQDVIDMGQRFAIAEYTRLTKGTEPRKKFTVTVPEAHVADLEDIRNELGSEGFAQFVHAAWLHRGKDGS